MFFANMSSNIKSIYICIYIYIYICVCVCVYFTWYENNEVTVISLHWGTWYHNIWNAHIFMILYLSHISLAWSHEIRQFEKSRYFDLLNEGRNHSNALYIDAIHQKKAELIISFNCCTCLMMFYYPNKSDRNVIQWQNLIDWRESPIPHFHSRKYHNMLLASWCIHFYKFPNGKGI